MNELALAAFAAETGEHVVKEPRERRFERFRRGFDAGGYLESLAARGFRFVGPTTAYALMQATGMVDDHIASCWVPPAMN